MGNQLLLLAVLTSILNHRVGDDGGDDNYAAKQCPLAGALADEKEDPHGIEERFDKADYAGIKRPCAAADTFYK